MLCRQQLNVNSQQFVDFNKFLDMTSATLSWCEETTKLISSLEVADELAAAGVRYTCAVEIDCKCRF
jgi:hypothetical protein